MSGVYGLSLGWLSGEDLVASLPSGFCVRLQLNLISSKSLQVLHPSISIDLGLGTSVPSNVMCIQLTRAKISYILASISGDLTLWWAELP